MATIAEDQAFAAHLANTNAKPNTVSDVHAQKENLQPSTSQMNSHSQTERKDTRARDSEGDVVIVDKPSVSASLSRPNDKTKPTHREDKKDSKSTNANTTTTNTRQALSEYITRVQKVLTPERFAGLSSVLSVCFVFSFTRLCCCCVEFHKTIGQLNKLNKDQNSSQTVCFSLYFYVLSLFRSLILCVVKELDTQLQNLFALFAGYVPLVSVLFIVCRHDDLMQAFVQFVPKRCAFLCVFLNVCFVSQIQTSLFCAWAKILASCALSFASSCSR